MSRRLRRRWKTLLYASHMKDLEEEEEGDLLRLVNGHLQRWTVTQTSPAAARESEFLVR